MITREDILIAVREVFGVDAGMVDVIDRNTGGFHVCVGAEGYDILDWSDMDLVDELYRYFEMDF